MDTIREGLNNILKHAVPNVAVIHLAYTEDEVRFAVQAESLSSSARAGGDPFAARGGLSYLRVRARQLNGELGLELGEDGTSALRLRFSLPSRP
jgi:signal transduction histidine kinase